MLTQFEHLGDFRNISDHSRLGAYKAGGLEFVEGVQGVMKTVFGACFLTSGCTRQISAVIFFAKKRTKVGIKKLPGELDVTCLKKFGLERFQR